jgi:hypothetical protein
MTAKLSVIFFIVLCLEVGVFLTIVPWYPLFGLNDWADNYLLVYAAHKTGMMSLQRAMASGWVRGAVSGLGILNLFMAFWEITHFNQTVRYLQGGSPARPDAKKDGAQPASQAGELSHHERRDDTEQHPGQ